MKKIFSAILALAMSMSLFTFTAQAGTDGYYELSYEAINVASGDVNKLAVGDTFWAVVTLKDAAGLFSGAVSLTWDSDKIQLSNASGAANTVFALVTDATSKVTNAAKTTGLNLNTGMEDDALLAFEQNAGTGAAGSLTYEFSAANITTMEGEDGFWDYLLDDDLTIVKARFKVLKAENPNFAFTTARVCEVKADGGNRNATGNVTPVGFASSEPETKDESFLTTVKYDASKTGVKFNVEDKAVVGRTASKEISYLAFVNAQVEAVENIVVGLTITDAPMDANLEVTAELY